MDQSAAQLRVEIAETRTNMGETLEAIGDRVSPGRVVERRKNRMMRSARDIRDRVMGTAQSAEERAGGAVHRVGDAVESAPEMVRERSAGNPLMAGGVAFGVGLLVAAAMPPSRTERELAENVGERIEPIKEQATEAVREVAEHMKEPAREAAEELKQSASDSAGHVAEQVRQPGSSTTGV